MKLPHRLEQAALKLYEAYYDKSLQPDCCHLCAVGNILDRKDFWKHFTDKHGSVQLNYVGLVHQNIGRTYKGYTPLQLLEIESVFLNACGFSLPLKRGSESPKITEDQLYFALMTTIRHLCKLEGIDSFMSLSPILQNDSEAQKISDKKFVNY